MTLDLDRIRSRAEAASGHPTWSVAYAEDVPALLAEIERLNEDARLHAIRAVDRYHKLGADRDRWRDLADWLIKADHGRNYECGHGDQCSTCASFAAYDDAKAGEAG